MGFKKGNLNLKYKDGRSKSKICSFCNVDVISYRSKKCQSCENKIRFTGKKRPKEYKEKLSRILKAKYNTPPMPLCKDCNKILTRRNAKYCKVHASKHIQRPPKKKYFCKDCNNKISYSSASRGSGRCKSCSNKGNRNPNYIDGRTPLRSKIRNLEEYVNWTWEVFRKDNFVCQECFKQKERKNLEAHHEISFAKILSEFLKEYDQFSPVEDKETLVRLAMKWKPFWDIDNGKTLCLSCHRLIEPRNIKRKVM